MREIMERTGRRLKLRCRGNGASTCICTLDLDRNVAEMSRNLVVPYRRTRVALSNVYDVVVQRHGRRKDYQPVFELRVGRAVSLGGYTKDEALEAARAIRDFLRENRKPSVVADRSAP